MHGIFSIIWAVFGVFYFCSEIKHIDISMKIIIYILVSIVFAIWSLTSLVEKIFDFLIKNR